MKTTHNALKPIHFVKAPRVLVVRAQFHEDLVAQLSDGATAFLQSCKATITYIDITGAMEIPALLYHAHKSQKFDAYVVLGCVIRGDTGHYDVVVNGTTHAIMQLVATHGLLIGNAILTIETLAQAVERADPKQLNKGGEAAFAALQLLQLTQEMIEI